MDRFVPGILFQPAGPLAAYRQMASEELVNAYIEAYVPPDGQLLAPFASSDTAARVAWKLGRHCRSAQANPLLALLADVEARPEPAESLDALFVRIAESSHHVITLRQHLLDLYRTRCPTCGGFLSAEAFIWSREPRQLLFKQYQCPACHAAGLAAVDPDDQRLAASYPQRGLAYWRALNRLAKRDEPAYERMQDFLELYTGRNIYALLELTRRLLDAGADGVPETTRLALLLECLDCSISLDSPERNGRLARLGIPARFVERNVWKAFEDACETGRRRADRPPLPQSDRVSSSVLPIGVGDLVRSQPVGSVDLVLAVPPDPQPTFWTLSYCWTAWLWGSAVATPQAPWLKRHHADWDWYTGAMASALRALASTLRPTGRIVLAWHCAGEHWIEALLAGASEARLVPIGLACQPGHGSTEESSADYRLVLASAREGAPAVDSGELPTRIAQAGLSGVRAALHARGEPTPGAHLHAAAWRQVSLSNLWPAWKTQPGEGSRLLALANALWDSEWKSAGIRPWPAGGQREESPSLSPILWWTPDADAAEPLGERVERCVVEQLAMSSGPSTPALLNAIYNAFPGDQTPAAELLRVILLSYATQDEKGNWHLRSEEQPARRQAECRVLAEELRSIAHRLGAVSISHSDADLRVELPMVVLLFRLATDSALAGLQQPGEEARRDSERYLVLPDTHVPLLRYKKAASPLWRAALDHAGWRLLTYRQVHQLAAMPNIGWDNLREAPALDPGLTEQERQIPLF